MDGERPDAACCAVDQHALSARQCPGVAQAVQCGQGRRRHGSRLFEREVGGLQGQLGVRRQRILGARPVTRAEYGVTRTKRRNAATDCCYDSREVEARHTRPWAEQAGGQSHEEWCSSHPEAIADVQRCGVDANEHVVRARPGHGDGPEREGFGWTVRVLGHRLHGVTHWSGPSCDGGGTLSRTTRAIFDL
jgi:hypothetical protein